MLTIKVMLFGKGGHIAATEKWFYNNTEIEIVNTYKYLGYALTNYLLMSLLGSTATKRTENPRPYENHVTTWELRFFFSSNCLILR